MFYKAIKMKVQKYLGDSWIGRSELSIKAVTSSLQKLILPSTERVVFASVLHGMLDYEFWILAFISER